MARGKTKLPKPVNPIISTDEDGRLVLFTIPYAALFYGYACVSLRAQDKIDDCTDRLIELHYSINEN